MGPQLRRVIPLCPNTRVCFACVSNFRGRACRRRVGRRRRDPVRAAAGRALRPGHRVAITAGSRGIANIAVILRAAVEHLRRLGAEPFIVPAMGSHGGGTAEGQRQILATYGITRRRAAARSFQHGHGDRVPRGRRVSGPFRSLRLRGGPVLVCGGSSRTRGSWATSRAA